MNLFILAPVSCDVSMVHNERALSPRAVCQHWNVKEQQLQRTVQKVFELRR